MSITGLAKNFTPKVNNNPDKKTIQPYKGAIVGGVIGASAGLIDGFVTDLSNKKTIDKALLRYKNLSLSAKKKAITELKNNGMNLKEYKKYATDIINKSPIKQMIKNAIIYGGALAIVGSSIDMYNKHKLEKANKK